MDDPIQGLIEQLGAGHSRGNCVPCDAASIIGVVVGALEKIVASEPITTRMNPLGFYDFVDKTACEALEKARKIARGE